ncbi:MAG: ParB/RepB/Spo0J family partition protein, partial [Pseudomonadota bacterium]
MFDAAELDQLAASIARSGVMQPIIVRPLPSGDHELVAGERRWRAARQAGLDRVPALVRSLDDETAAEWALVENLQRTDLNAMERARALRGLIDRFGLTQGEVADRVGLERSSVTNLVRLLELDSALQDLIEGGALSFGHGRALLAAREELRLELAERCIREGWSVRRLERESAALDDGNRDGGRGAEASGSSDEVASSGAGASPEICDLERRLAEHLGTAVNIRTSGDGSR